VIFRKVATTGDGILSALELLHILHSEKAPLHELAADLERWPQYTRNVKAPWRSEWASVRSFADEVRQAETTLASTGRVLVRPSGTEPVLRITVEARDETVASSTVQRLEDAAKKVVI
jgi:phosphoglucosamine mutase